MDSDVLECLALHYYDIAKRKFKRENPIMGWNVERWNCGVILWKRRDDGIEFAPFRGYESKDWAKLVVKECLEFAKKKGFKRVYSQALGFEKYMKKNGLVKLEENLYTKDISCLQ